MTIPTFSRCKGQGRFKLAPAFGVVLTFATLTWAADVDPSKRLADDFDAAAARLEAALPGGQMGSKHKLPPELRLGLDRCQGDAQALAKTYGPAATSFLVARLTTTPDNARKAAARDLALATLAALADDRDAANALTRLVADSRFSNRSALLAVTYAPADVARKLGRDTLASGNLDPRPLAGAAALLRFVGDEHDAEALRRAIDDLPRSPGDLRKSTHMDWAAADLVALRQRLSRPAAERADWAAQDLSVWRAANHESSTYRDKDTGLIYNQRSLAARGKLRTDYLRARLTSSPIKLDELRMILWTTAAQHETSLIPELTALVAQQRDGWTDALGDLLGFGTPEALVAVKRFIPPPPGKLGDAPATGSLTNAEAKRRAAILRLLSIGGSSRGYLDLMTELSADPAYPAEERADFARARDMARLLLTPSTGGMRSPPPKP